MFSPQLLGIFVLLKKYLRQSFIADVRINKHLLILISVKFPGAHNLDLFSDFPFCKVLLWKFNVIFTVERLLYRA